MSPSEPDALRALTARCEGRVNEIARRITADGVDPVPGLRELPSHAKDVEITAAVRHGLRLFLRLARGEQGPGSDSLHYFRERAAQHAEEGVPLAAVLQGHLGCHRALWAALRECALPGEEAALLDLADQLLAGQAAVLGAVAEAYLAERAALAAERQEELRGLTRALLAGTLAPERREELGVAHGGLVLAVHVGPVGSPVAARRRLRRLHTAAEREFGAPVLVHFDDSGGALGHVVRPHQADRKADLPADLAGRLGQALDGPVHLAWADASDPEEIAPAARTAAEVLRLVRALGRPAGHYHLEDVLLEYHLSRPGDSGLALAATLDPVGGRPELMETLRAYLDEGQDRRATADRLGLHANTVDNRVARIRALTGADASTPHGFARLLAALVARDLREDAPTSA